MQARFLIAATLVILFALVSARWSWVEDDSNTNTLEVAPADRNGPAHEVNTLEVLPADREGPAHEALAFESAEETLQQQGSLSSNHQEAKDADSLLNALIKRLTQQIADDSSATASKIESRTASIKKFDDAVTAAKAYLDDLTNQLTALNKKIDEAKTALATRQGEKSAEQAAIDKENAEQRARLADRIAAVEKQIALIKQILVLLSNVPVDQTIPDSIILDDTQERLIPSLFANTQWAGKKYVKCYRASESQYSSQAYNQQCNGKAGLLTIVKSSNGNVFGGFTAVSLDGSGSYKSDANAFLYSIVRSGQTNLVKLAQNGQYFNNNAYSAYTWTSYGPTFGGGHDLHVSHQCNANGNSYSNLGHSYGAAGNSYGSDGAKNLLAGQFQFTCAEYEVFQLV